MMLRQMTPADVEAGLRLCRLSHWNQLARDWDQFLRLEPRGATVAVDAAGGVVGSVATMRYASASWRALPGTGVAGRESSRGRTDAAGAGAPATLAWIAMVLVDPAVRGQGIGTALLQRGLAGAADAAAVGLDATPLGQPLYEKLGFRTDSTFTRMQLDAGPRPSADESARRDVRAATADDDRAIAALDAAATGLDRRAMLTWLREGAPGFAWISPAAGPIEGFILGRHGHGFCHLGPVVASSVALAATLVGACVSLDPERRVIVDIADAQPGWRERTEALGFRAQRPFTRMYRGDWRPAGDASHLFASIGAEFG